jgi:2-succinyl-6-hydroxy-2,4-cyclohexadiene-1-carboxylate synthase
VSPAAPLVCLHGFTQAGAMFEELAALLARDVVTVDLPGHGSAGLVAPTMGNARDAVAAAVPPGRPVPVLGYSMGGRVALRTALDRPSLVAALILVSASPGIADATRRRDRRELDERRAEAIEAHGVEAFVDAWLAQPMFAGLARRPAEWRERDRALRVANGAAGLAGALRGLGQGSQPDLRPRLGELAMPVLCVAGGADAAYAALAAETAAAVPDGRAAVVPGAGHAVVGEAPAELARLVAGFLDEGARGA